MPKVIAVFGVKNSGKTTTASYIVSRLASDGYRVGGIKHIHHEFTMDTAGKDTWKFAQGGATIVSSISPSEVALLRKSTGFQEDLERVTQLLEREGMEVIVTEGFQAILAPRQDVFKIVTARKEEDLRQTLRETSPPVLAVTGLIGQTNPRLRGLGIPVINLKTEGDRLYGIIRKRVGLR